MGDQCTVSDDVIYIVVQTHLQPLRPLFALVCHSLRHLFAVNYAQYDELTRPDYSSTRVAQQGFTNTLQWIWDERVRLGLDNETCCRQWMYHAGMGGQDDTVAYACAHWNMSPHLSQACVGAARAGRLDTLMRLDSNGTLDSGALEDIMIAAAQHGHVNIVQWCRDHRNGLSSQPASNNESVCERALHAAIQSGDMPTVKYIHKMTHSDTWRDMLHCAARFGHLHICKWIADVTDDLSTICYASASYAAAKYGHLAIVQWCFEDQGVMNPYRAILGAAKGGHCDIIQWLIDLFRNKNYILTEAQLVSHIQHAWNKCIKWGHVSVIEYIMQHFFDAIFTYEGYWMKAVQHNRLRVVENALERGRANTHMCFHGIEVQHRSIQTAARLGLCEMLRILFKHDFVKRYDSAMLKAAAYGHTAVVKMMYDEYGATELRHVLLIAERLKHDDMIYYCRQRLPPLCPTSQHS